LNVKLLVNFLIILVCLLLVPRMSLAAAIQNTTQGLAAFDNSAIKIEKLIDSNIPLAHAELKNYGDRFDELSLQQKISYQCFLAEIYILKGQFHLAKQIATDGLTLTLKLSSPSLSISELLYSRGFSYESIGENELATADYENGLELAKSLHDNVLTAQGLVNLGAIYYLTDRYKNSLTVLNDAYNIAKQTDDDELKGSVNSELGILYALLDRNEQAMVYYQQAYQHYKKAKKTILSLNTLINIGLNHLHEKKYEEAIVAYKNIINESDDVALNQILYSAYSGLSRAYLKKKDPNPEVSYQYLLLSKQYMASSEKYDIEIQYYTDEAFVLFELERFNEVINTIATIENILAKQMPLSQVKMRNRIGVINLKSKTYFELGHYKKAYDLQEQRLQLTREMSNKNQIKSIAEVRLALEAKDADLQKKVLDNEQILQKLSLLEAEKDQKKQRLYLVFIALVALIFAWLLIRLIQGQHRFYKASSLDMLTGIANRRKLMKTGRKLLNKAKNKQLGFSVIMIDIDRFKEINHQLGHSVGDNVLKKLVVLCEKYMNKNDFFGRFSDEEFIVFLPNTSNANAIAEQLRNAIENYSWEDTVTKPFGITISVGVAGSNDNVFNEQDNLMTLINRAENLLEQAKKLGRNRVCG